MTGRLGEGLPASHSNSRLLTIPENGDGNPETLYQSRRLASLVRPVHQRSDSFPKLTRALVTAHSGRRIQKERQQAEQKAKI